MLEMFEGMGKLDAEEKPPSRFLSLPRLAAELESLGMVKRVQKGTVFVCPGDTLDYCYVVRKGCVVGYDITSGGDERIYHVMLANSLMLEACAILGKPSPVYFKAVKNSELIVIPRKSFIGHLLRNNQLAMRVIDSLAHKYFAAMGQIRELQCHDATWMLCNLFFVLANTYGVLFDNKVIIKEKISQQHLSDLLGINRITTVRIISKLKTKGLIEQIDGFYCISDPEELQSYMDFDNDSRF
jgi:CRP/FNR family transcriptional regulator